MLIDARRSLLKARTHGYPVMQQLHRFMIVVFRVVVNYDGKRGFAPDLLVWDRGGPRKVRKTDIRISVDLAYLSVPCGFLNGPWMQVHGGCIAGLDVPEVLAFCASLQRVLALYIGLFLL